MLKQKYQTATINNLRSEKMKYGSVGRSCTHRFLMRDSAGLSVPSTSIPSTSVCPNRELLSSSSLARWRNTLKKHVWSLQWPVISGNDVNACCVCKGDLLLHSFTGIPSIFALMSFLFFLMAERTASKRKPGHLSSFRISLQKRTIICIY